MKLNLTTKNIALNAIYISIYVVVTYALKPFSYGAVQVRVSEALCILPLFDSLPIVSITIGCLIANALNGNAIDMVFGTLATFIGLFFTYVLRKKNFFVATSPTLISNAIIIPFVLKYGYGLSDIVVYVEALFILLGEALSVYLVGYLIRPLLEKNYKK